MHAFQESTGGDAISVPAVGIPLVVCILMWRRCLIRRGKSEMKNINRKEEIFLGVKISQTNEISSTKARFPCPKRSTRVKQAGIAGNVEVPHRLHQTSANTWRQATAYSSLQRHKLFKSIFVTTEHRRQTLNDYTRLQSKLETNLPVIVSVRLPS